MSVRLAVVSDIHGNLTALDAVIADLERREIDRVVHGGDLALAGCQPAEVIDRVRELGWLGVVGNVDELLWAPEEYDRQLRRAPSSLRCSGCSSSSTRPQRSR
jgi:predicted phosphodiesterase